MSATAPGRSGGSGFDVVVVVDWSASSIPKQGRDSIWIAVRTAEAVELFNPSTRHRASELLADVLEQLAGQRVLVGVDVALGYPSGAAQAAFKARHDGAPGWRQWWEHLAAHLVDGPDNMNNRFAVAAELNASIGPGAGPFWGVTTARAAGPQLTRTKSVGFPYQLGTGAELSEFRVVEQVLRAARQRPASIWQLAGAGAVGSQTLTCIPVLEALRRRQGLGRRVQVWPFETGLTTEPGAGRCDAIVVAEVWPTLCPLPDPWPHPVKDASQVHVLSERLAMLDRSGGLAAWFDPGVPAEIRQLVVDEEGWVLGVVWPAEGVDGVR